MCSCGGALARLLLELSKGLRRRLGFEGIRCPLPSASVLGGRAPPRLHTTRFLAVPCVAACQLWSQAFLTPLRCPGVGEGSRSRSGALLGSGAAAPFLPSCNSGMYLLELLAWHWGSAWCPRAGFWLARRAPPHRERCARGGFAQHGVGWVPTPSAQEACHVRAALGADFMHVHVEFAALLLLCMFFWTWRTRAFLSGWGPGSAGGAWGPHIFGDCADT